MDTLDNLINQARKRIEYTGQDFEPDSSISQKQIDFIYRLIENVSQDRKDELHYTIELYNTNDRQDATALISQLLNIQGVNDPRGQFVYHYKEYKPL